MALFRQVHVKMWSSPDFQELSSSARLVFIHLFSSSHRNECAIYRITPKTVSYETGLPVETVSDAMDELAKMGLVCHDPEQYTVWVVNALKYGQNGVMGLRAVLKELAVIDHPYVQDFLGHYRDLFVRAGVSDLPGESLEETRTRIAATLQSRWGVPSNAYGGVSEGVRGGLQGASKGGKASTGGVSDKISKDNLTEGKKNTQSTEAHRKEFEEVIWPPYPKKKDKQAAFKAYCARRNAGVPLEDLKTAEERYVAEVRRKGTQSDYVKNLATFFAAPKDKKMPAPWQEYLNPNGGERPHSVLDTLPDLSERLDQIRREAMAS